VAFDAAILGSTILSGLGALQHLYAPSTEIHNLLLLSETPTKPPIGIFLKIVFAKAYTSSTHSDVGRFRDPDRSSGNSGVPMMLLSFFFLAFA
jgi:hypothetical protein